MKSDHQDHESHHQLILMMTTNESGVGGHTYKNRFNLIHIQTRRIGGRQSILPKILRLFARVLSSPRFIKLWFKYVIVLLIIKSMEFSELEIPTKCHAS